MQKKKNNIKSSFRDPNGFVFTHKGSIYRYVSEDYKKDYEHFFASGLYKALVEHNYIVPFKEVTIKEDVAKGSWKILKPEQIPFISYPYEWGFSMMKDAALVTLRIQRIALKHGMNLKDASAFNMQFVNGKPIHIDSLSFEIYEEGKPWVAYKQFVEHFLSPLLLMSMVDVRLNRLSATFLDGIPVDLAASMLPFKSKLNISLLIHIFGHAKSQKQYADKKLGKTLDKKAVSLNSVLGMLDDLERTIKKLTWTPEGTQWNDYYDDDKNNYEDTSLKHKATLVETFLKKSKPKQVWDMGANTGFFSNIALKQGAEVLSFDIDYGAIEKNYHDIKKNKKSHILPLFSDLANPTPSTGWENEERHSLFERGPADTVMALALIHHLAISNNVPFPYLASCFAKMGKYLIVEFIDKQDSQVQILLANRKDIFPNYTKKDFEDAFIPYFKIKESVVIKGSKRTLYLMERK